MARKYELKLNDLTFTVTVEGPNDGAYNITIDDSIFPVQIIGIDRAKGIYRVKVDDQDHTLRLQIHPDSEERTITVEDQEFTTHLSPVTTIPSISPIVQTTPSPVFDEPVPALATSSLSMEPGTVVAPLPGRVLEISVKKGDEILAGKVLLVLEAMKMANEIRAPQDGVVNRLHVQAGDTVEKGQPLVTLH